MAQDTGQKVWAHIKAAWDPRATLRAILPPRGGGGSGGGGKARPRFAALDGLRALALIWVLAYHSIGLSNLRDLDLAAAAGADVAPADGADAAGAGSADALAGSGLAAAGGADALAGADATEAAGAADGAASMLATASVALKWVTSWQTQLWLNGYMGVDCFFTLSGLLIAHYWLKEVIATGEFRYRRFLVRRFLRLWPMLMVAVFYATLVYHLYGDQAGVDACLSRWWTFALLINNYMVCDCLGHAWTVAVEAQMYVLTPLLMWAAFNPRRRAPRRWGYAGLVGASLAGVAVNLGLMLGQGPSAFTMPTTWPPTFQFTFVVTRSPPYIAGTLAAMALAQARRLPLASPPPCSCDAEAAGGGGSGKAAGRQTSCAAHSGGHVDKAGRPDEGPALPLPSNEAAAVDKLPSDGAAAVDLPLPGEQAPPARVECTPCGEHWSRRAARRLAAAAAAVRLDWPALLLCCGLAYCGTGMSTWIQQQAPVLNEVLQVAGSWAYGWALAAALGGVLRGRLRPLRTLLTLRVLVPAAALSYSAYLLQDWPMLAFPTWLSAGVTTMWAAWAAALLSLLLISGMALLLALPAFFAVERPCAQLWPRTW